MSKVGYNDTGVCDGKPLTATFYSWRTLDQFVHQVGPHRVLDSRINLGSRMHEIALLEDENAAHFGVHIHLAFQIVSEERGRTPSERLLGVALRCVVVQVEMQRIEGSLSCRRVDVIAVEML